MEKLATLSDLEDALGGELDESDHRIAETWLVQASDLVKSYARWLPDEIPGEVRRVVAAMVARSFNSPQGVAGQVQMQQTAGPFSQGATFEAGSRDGGPWLSKADKLKLRRWHGGAYSVQTW